ncbi:putative amino acid transporter [Aspergillus karnatakaensis]|uniref:putative amino acid transporter n=1 Tax=Aspergillus karnatakaensis TaxID=1810916 RepID=UPI003CCE329E
MDVEQHPQHQQKDKVETDSKCSQQITNHDVVFGEITEDGPNYRNVGLVGTVILMMKTQIGLGVLAIPTAFDTLGIVPGVLVLTGIAAIITWSNYVIGTFKLNHPEVYSIDDVGGLLFGGIGRGVLAVVFCLYWIFVVGSGILGISIGLNAVSTHDTCTAVFTTVAAIVGFACSSVRTLGKITWFAWIGLPCILTAVIIVCIAVGLQDKPATAPEPWIPDYQIIAHPSFTDGITAVSNLVFAFSGTPGFFAIVSEMRDPRQYTRAVLICQGSVTAVYIAIGCVVYYYCGSYVAAPALGSAGQLIKQICYGIALPGLVVTTTICSHVPAKFIFVNLLRGTPHLTANTPTHWITWISCTLSIAVIAFIIASTIPIFDSLVSLIGALLGTLMCFQPMGCMWLYDNWKKDKGLRERFWRLKVVWAGFVVLLGCFLTVAGTYGCITGIIDSYAAEGGQAAFSCADNSNST